MNTGKTLFAQRSWTSCHGLLSRGSSTGMAAITGSGRFPAPSNTGRHGLRPADLPAKPARHRDLPLGPASKLYHMGIPPAAPALDAGRCQRKAMAYPAALAQRLITQAAVRRRRTGVGPDQYRLRPGLDDHRSEPVGFPWAHFRNQGAGEDAHAARPAGQHSEFYPHLGWQAARRSCPRYVLPEAGAIYVVDRGYVDFARLYVLHQAGAFFVTLAKSNIDAHRVYSAFDGSLEASFATRPSPWTASTPVRITPNFCGASASRTPSPARRWSSSPTTSRVCHHLALYKSRWQVELFFKWIKQHLRIKHSTALSEIAVTQIWIAVSVYVLVAIVKKRLDLDASLYTLLQILSVTLFEKMPIHKHLRETKTDATLRK